MRICIYEDQQVRGLEPLTLTRPVSDLICGLDTLGVKQTRYFRASSVGYLCRPVVAGVIRERTPRTPVNDPVWLRAASTILVNARWVPPAKSPLRSTADPFLDGPHLGTVNGQIAYAVLDARHLLTVSPQTLDDCLEDWSQTLPAREVGGDLVTRPWELVDLNAAQIAVDFEVDADPGAAGFHPTGFAVVGPADRLYIHPTARIDPMVVADTTSGPVSIGAGAIIQAFTRLEGPCGIGVGSVVLGAKIRSGTTIGPHCRVGGEIERSILLGYDNKYHEGFLGHSYLGEWVNLAAGTHTSDLRLDYRPVTVPINGAEVPTGRLKVGAIVGDHVRTGLGVLLNSGTIAGPFAQILPTGGFAPREVAAFTRVGPRGVTVLDDVDRVLVTADTMLRRRGRVLTPALDAVYRSLAGASVGRHGHQAEAVRPLRRSA